MTILHLPWLELSIAIPLIGALWIARKRDPEHAQRLTIVVQCLALLATIGAWVDFGSLRTFEAHDRWDLVSDLLGGEALIIDELNAPLLPLAALMYLATAIGTMRTKIRRFSFAGSLISETILLATLSTRSPWMLVLLLGAGAIPPWLELRARRKPARVYALHMALFLGLLTAGQILVRFDSLGDTAAAWGIGLSIAGLLVRCGVVPFHVWVTDLFEHATFGTSLLFVTPMVGAYAVMRLIVPVASEELLHGVALWALVTAVYSSGMALIQREARRFFSYVFLSHSALVLVGLDLATPIGLTGGLSIWLSLGLAMTGFGLTLRSIEARIGRVSLAEFHGLYEHTPRLAVFFLLTGLACVGFPGTFGFIGTELLVEGAVAASPWVGAAVVLAAALNGIAVVQAYFRVFTGARHRTTIPMRSRTPEKAAVLTLTLLIFGGGLYPQPGIASRYHAAIELIEQRRDTPLNPTKSPGQSSHDAAARRPTALPGTTAAIVETSTGP